MLHKPIPTESSIKNRAFGALQAIGGTSEIVVGVVYTGSTGGVGAILGGGLLVAHGVDGLATGTKQVLTGQQQETVTQQTLEPIVGRNLAAISDVAISLCSGGAVTAITRSRNLLLFGMPTKPFLFRALQTEDLRFFPEQIPRVSLEQIRTMPGEKELIYVITKEGELLISQARFIKPMTVGDRTLTYVAHPEIAGISKPVVSAGEIIVHNGQITEINNLSGHFKPVVEGLKDMTEHAFNRHGFSEASGKFKLLYSGKIGSTVGTPIAQNEWIWPTIIASGTGLSRIPANEHFWDAVIPSAYASSSSSERNVYPLGFSVKEWSQARSLFEDTSLLSRASSAAIAAALFMKRDPDDLFGLGPAAQKLTESTLSQALYSSFSSQNVDTSAFGKLEADMLFAGTSSRGFSIPSAYAASEPGQTSQPGLGQQPNQSFKKNIPEFQQTLFDTKVARPINNFLEHHADPAKKQHYQQLLNDIKKSLFSHQEVNTEQLNELTKLVKDEVLPVTDLIANAWTTEDIHGFESHEDIVKAYTELENLKAAGVSRREIFAKAEEVKNLKTKVIAQHLEIDSKLENAGCIAEGLSLVGKWTKNQDLQRIGVIGSSAIGIARIITSGALLANPFTAGLGIMYFIGNIVSIFSGNENSSQIILEAIQQVAELVNQVRKEMHIRFDEVMHVLETIYRKLFDFFSTLNNGIATISERLEYMQRHSEEIHQRELSYLEGIATTLENNALKTQAKEKTEKLKKLITDNTIMKKR